MTKIKPNMIIKSALNIWLFGADKATEMAQRDAQKAELMKQTELMKNETKH